MSTPLVSIVITSFNYGAYLKECVDSAYAQTYANFEVCIVDDGSTEPLTHQVLKDLQNTYPSLQCIKQVNQGPAAARNAGISATSGAYILCLDSDDRLLPNCVHEMVKAITQAPDRSPVYSDFYFFGDQNGPAYCKEWSLLNLKKGNFLTITSLFSREAWHRCGGFDPLLFGLEDYEFWLHMGLKGYKGFYLHKHLFEIRVHANPNRVNTHSGSMDPNKKKDLYIRRKHKIGFWNTLRAYLNLGESVENILK